MTHARKLAAATALGLAAATPGYTQDAGNLFEVAASSERFSTLVAALEASDVGWVVEEDMSYTLFAPTDDAFSKLPEGVLDALLQPENQPKLNAILERHIVPDEQVASSDLSDGQSINPATGEPLEVSIAGGQVMVEDGSVVEADIRTEQGIVHAIDTVLVPELVIEAMKYNEQWPENEG